MPSSPPPSAPERIHRFEVGQEVWVRDVGSHGHGYKVVRATVREQHEHPGRQPWYPNGEGYSLDGQLWWDCYPGCRVFATREEAIAARLPHKVAETCFACGGYGWVPGGPEHHPSCNGNCRGLCPIQTQEQCKNCQETGKVGP